MWEDLVCTFKADIFHDFEEVIEKFVGFYLSFVEPGPKCVEFCEVLVCEEIFEFCLELFVAQLAQMHVLDQTQLFEEKCLVFFGDNWLLFL